MSIEDTVAAAFLARLAVITQANGYATDIGRTRFDGNLNIEREDVPCLTLIHGDDEPEQNKDPAINVVNQRVAVIIEAHDFCDPNNPNVQGRAMVADIKRALFDPEHPRLDKAVAILQYQGRTIQPRAIGTDLVAVGVKLLAVWKEDLANP